MDEVRDLMRLQHYAIQTERACCSWIARFIHFHKMRAREANVKGVARYGLKKRLYCQEIICEEHAMLYRILLALLLLTQLPVAGARDLTGAEVRQLKETAAAVEPAADGTPVTAALDAYMRELLEAGVSLESLVAALVANADEFQNIGLADASAESLAGVLQGLASPAQLAVALMAAGYPADEAVSAVAAATATPVEALVADSEVAAGMAAPARAAADSAASTPEVGKGAPVLLLQNAVSPS